MKNHIIISLLILSVGLSQQLIPQITETYKNGNIKSITYHKNTRDKIEKVKYVEYDENGQKEYEGSLKDGKMISKTEWQYWGKGQKRDRATYKNGELDGLSVGWYENGQKYFEGTYKDGKVVELIGRWNEDGSVRKEPFFWE